MTGVVLTTLLISACASSGAVTQRRAALAEQAYAETLQQTRVAVDTLRAGGVMSAGDAKVWYRSLLRLHELGVAINQAMRAHTAPEAIRVAVGVVDQIIMEDLPSVPEANRRELLLLLTSIKATLLVLSVVT
jgi:hypothetical protein